MQVVFIQEDRRKILDFIMIMHSVKAKRSFSFKIIIRPWLVSLAPFSEDFLISHLGYEQKTTSSSAKRPPHELRFWRQQRITRPKPSRASSQTFVTSWAYYRLGFNTCTRLHSMPQSKRHH